MIKPIKEKIKGLPKICSDIVEIVNSSTGSIALTIMFYYFTFKQVGFSSIPIFIIEILTVWGIWGFHAYNKITSRNHVKKEAISIGLLIILYVSIIFIFTYESTKQSL
ncbi:hypothetical protein [Gilliamella apicola]|uniref:hypothetical protein n=1 Tax=Gilliamella apicola TaxID=1196095 RepID=UPI003986B994